jgi:mRNA-degrading endonuclease RelE of RelBE toxin-antitoxin system
MGKKYKILVTSHFERDLKQLKKTESKIRGSILEAQKILGEDPYNQSGKYNIEKIVADKIGKWRLRQGDYRIRYDIEGEDVILYSVKHRREIYRGL